MKPDHLIAEHIARCRERPILFTTEMVEAIAAGLKIETRRESSRQKRYGVVGDQLWVKETYYAWGRWERRYSVKKHRVEWHFVDTTLAANRMYQYVACARSQTLPVCTRRVEGVVGWWLRPALFMPREASRWLLNIRGVDIERLTAITEEGARREGYPLKTESTALEESPIQWYRCLWDGINAKSGLAWESDPLVVVVRFELAIRPFEALQDDRPALTQTRAAPRVRSGRSSAARSHNAA